jgi:deoxycytidylate deaminase
MHACLIVRGGGILAMGYNHGSCHAETMALKQIWGNKRKGATLISIRITKGQNLLANAKPCPNCEKAIRESGIKKVYYSTEQRTMELMKL